jgi:dethiobiotin synthetase
MDNRTVFMTGTDTGVGKTVVSAALLAHLERDHIPAVYLKPIQTGCQDLAQDSDAAWVRQATGGNWPLADRSAVVLPAPKAPSIAAQLAGISIDPESLVAWVQRFGGVRLVEGAGGIRVPIAPGWTMLEFARALKAQVVVVARAGLGTINHTVLTLEALERAQVPCLGVVLCDPQGNVPPEDQAENAAAITLMTGVPVCGTLGPITHEVLRQDTLPAIAAVAQRLAERSR